MAQEIDNWRSTLEKLRAENGQLQVTTKSSCLCLFCYILFVSDFRIPVAFFRHQFGNFLLTLSIYFSSISLSHRRIRLPSSHAVNFQGCPIGITVSGSSCTWLLPSSYSGVWVFSGAE